MKAFKFNPGGLWITFENGWSLSIQCHAGTYSDNHMATDYGNPNCETAIITPGGDFHRRPGDADSVQSYQSLREVLETLEYVKSR